MRKWIGVLGVVAIPTSFWLQAYIKLGNQAPFVVDVGNFQTLSDAQTRALQIGQEGVCIPKEGGEVVMRCYPSSAIFYSFIIKTQYGGNLKCLSL